MPCTFISNILITHKRGEHVGYVIGSNAGNDCNGGNFHSHEKNIGVLENVAVYINVNIKLNSNEGSLRLKDNSLILASGYRADYDSFIAFDSQNGHTFWFSNVPDSKCSSTQVFVAYQGEATKLIDFAYDGTKRTTFVVKDVGEERDFLIVILKILHLAHDVGRQISELYADLMFEKCITDSKVILNMLALAKLDPVDWGYLFFKQP